MTRLEYGNDAGVRIREWPIDELSIENIRARWGSGEFKVHWFSHDPENEDPNERRRPQGHGPNFTLEPETPAASVAAPAGMTIPNGGAGDVALHMMNFAMSFAKLQNQQTAEQISTLMNLRGAAGAPAAAAPPEMNAELLRLMVKDAARDAADAVAAKYEAQIAELKKKLEEAEEDDDDESAPLFTPGAPLLEQIGYGILNAAAKNPDLVSTVLAPVLSRFLPAGAPQSAPPPAPANALHGAQPTAARNPDAPRVVIPVVPAQRPGPRVVTSEPPPAESTAAPAT